MPMPLPDFRDGLTPWTRLLLSSLRRHRASSDGRFLKTIKLIAPLGDRDRSAAVPEIYAALLRLARDWVCRYPLVENQGNIGSIDGDPPAGMRYNEMRLSPFGEALLGKDPGEGPLPGPFPNLLCNGAWAHSGAVATELCGDAKADLPGDCGPVDYVPLDRWTGGTVRSYIPSHNLGEIGRALVHLIDHPRGGLDDLLKHIQGPDFPTGGFLIAGESVRELYETGSGCIRVRGKAGVASQGRAIVVSEIPFGISKTDIIEQLATRAKSREDGWISDIVDLSSREGMSLELRVRRGYDREKLLQLFQNRPPLEQTLEFKLVGHRGAGGRQVSLLTLLRYFIDHRRQSLGLRRGPREHAILRKEFEHLVGLSDPRRTRILRPDDLNE